MRYPQSRFTFITVSIFLGTKPSCGLVFESLADIDLQHSFMLSPTQHVEAIVSGIYKTAAHRCSTSESSCCDAACLLPLAHNLQHQEESKATAPRQFMGGKSMDIWFLMDIVIGSVSGTGTGPTIYSAALLASTNTVCGIFDVYLFSGSG